MAEDLNNLSKEQLIKLVIELQNSNKTLQSMNEKYEEMIRLNQRKLFGRSSEKLNEDQLSFLSELFNETEAIIDYANSPEGLEEEKKKKKSGSNTNHITQSTFKKVSQVYHTIENPVCNHCGSDMRSIGQEVAFTEVIYHPSYYELVQHMQEAYICPNNCVGESEGPHGESEVIKAPLPNRLVPKSPLSSSLAAKIIYDKFERSLPLYRQEKHFNSNGLCISRQTMSNWLSQIDTLYMKPTMELFYKKLKESKLILMDETRVEVIKHPTKQAGPSNSYMWVARTGRFEKDAVVIYQYEPGRNYEFATKILENYKGMVQSDGYQAYDHLEQLHLGCCAHMRRKYSDVLTALPKGMDKKTTQAFKFEGMLTKMFNAEKKIKNKSIEERVKYRQEVIKPMMEAFYEEVESIYEIQEFTPGNAKFKEAITYSHNQKAKILELLKHGEADLSTNAVENIIRNFTLGRRNWLFFNTVSGAETGGALYSLIVTAKENGLKPEPYLQYFFEHVKEIDIEVEEELDKLMPWSESLPEDLKKNNK